MPATTCAACDADVGPNPISVTIAGKTVEVCCEECADSLREASKSASKGGATR